MEGRVYIFAFISTATSCLKRLHRQHNIFSQHRGLGIQGSVCKEQWQHGSIDGREETHNVRQIHPS